MPETVTIERIGHRGDGIAETAAGALYVPFTLPGEQVRVEREGARARLLDISTPSAARVAPPCPHFGVCGGCALQMMKLDETRELKRRFVADALRLAGIVAEVEPTVGVPPASRRRAALTAVKVGGRIILGYHQRQSNRLIDVAACPVLAPAIAGRLPALREVLRRLPFGAKPVRLTVLSTRAGLDLAVTGCPPPKPREVAALTPLLGEANVARLTVAGEPVMTLAEPVLDVAGVSVAPPPGAFAQASREAEDAMAALVAEHAGSSTRALDLFSGFGTFSFALARTMPVHAVEADEAALAALNLAARRASGRKAVTTERRDLFRFPLPAAELGRFDFAVFDPPAAGAKRQAEALAASRVPRIAAVSCNPASLARDARTLLDGGYALSRVVPIDQFVWSAEVEAVALFARR